jgi:hypothetical protein
MTWTAPSLYRPTSLFVSPISFEGLGMEMRHIQTAGTSSTAWGSATLALYVPVICPGPFTVAKFWWYNGATVNASYSIEAGLYDASGNKLLGTASTAQGTLSTLQEADVTDTLFPAGRYYIALACNNATATFGSFTASSDDACIISGLAQEASATLPTTATFAAFAQTFVPLFGFTQRTLV